MKSLIINTIACCTLLLPITQAQAAGAGSTFGGFTPKQTLNLTVTGVSSVKTVGTTTTVLSQVPKQFPEFKLKQNVKFTIGSKGQLTGPAISIPFDQKTSGVTINNYRTSLMDNPTPVVFDSAVINKKVGATKNTVATGGSVVLSNTSTKGMTKTVLKVTYQFTKTKG